MGKYPEHEKLHTVTGRSQAIGDFISEFLQQKGIVLAEYHEHGDACENDNGFKNCGYRKHELESVRTPIGTLLAEYFGIDQKKIDAEKDEMLKELAGARG